MAKDYWTYWSQFIMTDDVYNVYIIQIESYFEASSGPV